VGKSVEKAQARRFRNLPGKCRFHGARYQSTRGQAATFSRVRVFAGYAGWEAGQLEREQAAGDWRVVPVTAKLLFQTPTDLLWNYLAPPRIPQHSLN
jgi:putative AlgH/UPF0301 family transcriptional regulator